MRKIILNLLLVVGIYFAFSVILPAETFAQTPATTVTTPVTTPTGDGCKAPNNIAELFTFGVCLLTKFVIPFLFALALVMFLVGVLKYVKNGDNEEAREAGRGLMLFGIIALFVMTAVWGLVRIVFTTIFGGSDQKWEMPSLPPQSSSPFQ